MRWLKYSAGGKSRWGAVEGGNVVELEGGPFDGPAVRTGAVHRFEDVTVEVPFIPKTMYCAGLNYIAHVSGSAEWLSAPKIPSKPDVNYRGTSALVAHDVPVIIPADATRIHYEGELVVVIGRQARHVKEEDASSYILGYTIGNDVSERDWQKTDRTFWRAKNSDTFAPMGPWIDTGLSQADLEAMETIIRLNGKETYRFRTNDMVFSIAQHIAAVTKYVTLYPGDVIWMGTDGKSPDLHPGDVVEVELTGLGILQNRFVAEGAA
jgi:2-keto-4-pentenoate hydratase/2-oxohepta-3-ene-1,7-dioic acid hydratase in catechol pathway